MLVAIIGERRRPIFEADVKEVQALLDDGKTLAEIREENPRLAEVIDHIQFEQRPRPSGCAETRMEDIPMVP